jgi:cephalosporin hydroxylase
MGADADDDSPEYAPPVSQLRHLARLTGTPIEQKLENSLGAYWLDRATLHTEDSYAGIPLYKFPEDLRVYEHLLWSQRPNVVVEIGSWGGGSALWFRDRLLLLAAYGLISEFRVISIDIEIDRVRELLDHADPTWERNISLVAGDVCDESLPARVAEMLPEHSSCFVVEDSAHTYETTLAALEGFSPFVARGGFMVVEDGVVDIEPMRLYDHWPSGVLRAIERWLSSSAGAGFRRRRDLELYGVTGHPQGFLQRKGSRARPRSG